MFINTKKVMKVGRFKRKKPRLNTLRRGLPKRNYVSL